MCKKYDYSAGVERPFFGPEANADSVQSQIDAAAHFVGRARELDQLADALREALQGRSGIAVLAGEPGIGKTRTVREFIARVAPEDVQVLWGLCYEGEETPPYGPWRAALRRYILDSEPSALVPHLGRGAAAIAEVVPEVREKFPDLVAPVRLPPVEARVRLYESLIGFLRSVSRAHGLLIFLDNLQWADPSSLPPERCVAMSGSRKRWKRSTDPIPASAQESSCAI